MDLARDCDATVVMVRHSVYSDLDLAALNQVMRTPVSKALRVAGHNEFLLHTG